MFRVDRDYCDSNNKIPLTDEEELMKVTDSEDSEEFIEKSNAEKSLNYENIWIQIYKEVLKILSINKDTDYMKWVTELKNYILYIIQNEFTQC